VEGTPKSSAAAKKRMHEQRLAPGLPYYSMTYELSHFYSLDSWTCWYQLQSAG